MSHLDLHCLHEVSVLVYWDKIKTKTNLSSICKIRTLTILKPKKFYNAETTYTDTFHSH